MNITDKSELSFKPKNNSDTTPTTNKIGYKRHWAKMREEKLTSVYDLLLSKDSSNVEPNKSFKLIQYTIKYRWAFRRAIKYREPQEKMENHDGSITDLSEELLSVLIDLYNAEPNTQHKIGGQLVLYSGLKVYLLWQLLLMKNVLQVRFAIKRFLIWGEE